jgi:predicted PurR-regulated permease PerM
LALTLLAPLASFMIEPDPPEVTLRVDRIVVAAAAIGVVALALFVLAPLWAPLIFAVWTAVLLDSFTGRVTRLVGGHRAISAGLTTALVALLLVPLVLLLVSLITSVTALVREMLGSVKARHAIEMLVSSDPTGGAPTLGPGRWMDLAQAHGAAALRAGQRFAGAGAWALVVLLVFFVTLYQCLAEGRAMWAWVKVHLPLRPETTARLAAAFVETGRGLIVGAGLTSLLQASCATILYAALGVPRAIVLGALTFVASVIPGIGTSVVWLPVAVGLGLRGDYVRATILLLVGALVISTIDNVTRPIFQRWGGRLELPAFLLLLAAFGGLNAFGPAGLALGPLSLRMAHEVLKIARERRTKLSSDS